MRIGAQLPQVSILRVLIEAMPIGDLVTRSNDGQAFALSDDMDAHRLNAPVSRGSTPC